MSDETPSDGPGASGAIFVLVVGAFLSMVCLAHSWWAATSAMSVTAAIALLVGHWGWWRR